MAAKKKKTAKTTRPGKKAAAKKKAGAKKKATAGKKTAAKKSTAAKKKAAAKKATPKKKAAVKKAAAPAKAAPEKKAASHKRAGSPVRTAPKTKSEDVAKPRPAGSVSSMDVNLGHVFGLKPRVLTSFRQHHFLEAKRALVDEVFEDLAQAARAVAEEALAITRGTAKGPDFRKRG